MAQFSELMQIKHAIRKRSGDFFFLLYTIGCIPLIAWFVANESNLCNRHLMYTLVWTCLLFLIALVLDNKKRIAFLWIIWSIALIPAMIILSYTIAGSTYLEKTDLNPVFSTNPTEAGEFIQQFIDWKTIFILALYLFIGFFYLLRIRKNRLDIGKMGMDIKIFSRKIFVNIYGITASFILFFSFLCILQPSRIQYTTYFNCFYYMFYLYETDLYTFISYSEKRKNIDQFPVETNFHTCTSQATAVIIIGESLSKHHISLYGYPRETTPRLDSISNELLIYKDVISPDTQTEGCMKTLLTFADNMNLDPYFTQPSIIEISRSAGFYTYWIESQGMIGKSETQVSVLSQKSDTLIDISKRRETGHEEVILDVLRSTLSDTTRKYKTIFIHLIGSHSRYKDRYPESFSKFDNSYPFVTSLKKLNNNQKETINEYDNSVLYNDFVVSSIIDIVKKKEDFSYVLYFSDHSEEMFEFRRFSGHTSGNISRYMCEIPFILWRSEAYKENVKLSVDTDRPYSTEDLIYSISQLSGLQYKSYDPAKSIFSTDFKPKERNVRGKPYSDLIP